MQLPSYPRGPFQRFGALCNIQHSGSLLLTTSLCPSMAAFGPLLLRTTTSATSRALSRNAKGATRQCRERCGAAAAAPEARAAAAPSVSALQHLERRRGISSSARGKARPCPEAGSGDRDYGSGILLVGLFRTTTAPVLYQFGEPTQLIGGGCEEVPASLPPGC